MSEFNITRLDAQDPGFAIQLDRLLAWDESSDAAIHDQVLAIIDRVKHEGDAALLEYTARFDHYPAADMGELELGRDVLKTAWEGLPPAQAQALQTAADRIRAYAERQKMESWRYTETDGTVLGQQITPLDRVGVYVPGGKAAYPSSVLMNIIPAKVAGVPEIIMVVPTPRGEVNELVLAAAWLSGVDRVFRIGGAQAVAALAYGTASVPRVDKITGPGNIYVATAKKLVFGQCGIDMIAGPSEILIISDGLTPPDWIAMDLFSQAEHDENAQAILISPDRAHLHAVAASIAELLPTLERKDVIAASLSSRGALIHVEDLQQAAEVANRIAPEHLELSVADPDSLLQHIRNAGAIFMGRHTAEALGDYCAGPNHVLPTAGTARFSSPLGVYDFQKRSSLIFCSAAGADELGKTASVLARGEGLTAHARSAEYRILGAEHKPMRTLENQAAALLRAEVLALSAYHVQDSTGFVKLDAMENPYRWPEAMINDWLEALRPAAVNRYPDPAADNLRQALRVANAVPADIDIMLGNGSDELIQIILMALASDATVLAPQPSFVMYRQIAVSLGLRFVGVDLKAEDFSLDMDAMRAAIAEHQPKVIFLAYPNNPTGNAFASEDVLEILRLAPGLVVVDEAYAPFADGSFLPRLADFPHLLVMRTLSKLGLAGLRLGFLLGHPAWIGQLDKLRLPYNINVLTQLTAEFALARQTVFDAQIALIRRDREQLAERLKEMPLRVFPSQANFVTFRVLENDADDVFAQLKKAGVLIKNLNPASGLLRGCLRATVGTSEENQKLVEALKAIVKP